MSLFSFFKKKKKNTIMPKIDEALIVFNSDNSIDNRGYKLHGDLKGMIWFGDGINKNYITEQSDQQTFEIAGIKISSFIMKKEEPSLLFVTKNINKPIDKNKIERPPYFPSYSDLTPEQRWIYLTSLSNPYDSSIDISYVFILYYGLERHLIYGNFEKAFDIILNLRDVHNNKSFQKYSGDALVLTCLLHQRSDMVIKFINSLDKTFEFGFSDDLFLLCYYSFDIPVLAEDIMRMTKSFEFTNTNYIKKYPDLFRDSLRETIMTEIGTESVDLKKYITTSELSKSELYEVSIFANTSIIGETTSIPLLSDNIKLKEALNLFLKSAHNTVKLKLAEMRKTGKTISPQSSTAKKTKKLVFDTQQESILLVELSKYKKKLVDRHFTLMQLQDFYYKYRDLNSDYIEKCIKYCLLDLDSLPEMQEEYNAERIHMISVIKQMSSYDDTINLKEELTKIEDRGFVGIISAFKRLAIIYEKRGDIEKAISVCDRAINYGQQIEEFKIRKIKLEKKVR